MPTPKQWTDRDHLVRELKKYKWKEWFDKEQKEESKEYKNQSDKELKKRCESELQQIIKNAVGANTFRAFKCHGDNHPSVTFREWAYQALNQKRTLDNLWSVKSQDEYNKWLSKLVRSFREYWESKMGEVAYGPYFKMCNLLVKRLCLLPNVMPKQLDGVVWYLHVPLDSYTIAAVKNCVESFPDPDAIGKIRSDASMGDVKDEKMYEAFQSGIRDVAREAGVPPITLDCLAWDSGHDD